MGLNDCKGLPTCGLTESQTVMWENLTANGLAPTVPTPCDILWANVYEARMR